MFDLSTHQLINHFYLAKSSQHSVQHMSPSDFCVPEAMIHTFPRQRSTADQISRMCSSVCGMRSFEFAFVSFC